MHSQLTRSARLAQMIEDRAAINGNLAAVALRHLREIVSRDGVPPNPIRTLAELRLVLEQVRIILLAVHDAASTNAVPDSDPSGLDLAALLEGDVFAAAGMVNDAMALLAYVARRGSLDALRAVS